MIFRKVRAIRIEISPEEARFDGIEIIDNSLAIEKNYTMEPINKIQLKRNLFEEESLLSQPTIRDIEELINKLSEKITEKVLETIREDISYLVETELEKELEELGLLTKRKKRKPVKIKL